MSYAIRDKKTGEFFEGIDRGVVWTSPRLSDAKILRTRKDAVDIVDKLRTHGCPIDFEAVKAMSDSSRT